MIKEPIKVRPKKNPGYTRVGNNLAINFTYITKKLRQKPFKMLRMYLR